MSVTRQIVKEQDEMWVKSGVMPDLCIVSNDIAVILRFEYLTGEPYITYDAQGDNGKIGNMKLKTSELIKGRSFIITKGEENEFEPAFKAIDPEPKVYFQEQAFNRVFKK